MNKTGIMQPYFFPYIGYWQMINAVDTLVVYDDVNFIKGGWINRNNILLNEKSHLITLGLSQASSFKKINEIEVSTDRNNNKKLLACIESGYKKAPFFSEAFPVIEKIILNEEQNLALFLATQIKLLCEYLNIDTKIIMSSSIDKNNDLKGQDKVIEICKKLNTEIYINAVGGQELYSKEDFRDAGMELNFIKTKDVEYKQFKNEFVPWLSIIDLMMFNSKEEITEFLNSYELI